MDSSLTLVNIWVKKSHDYCRATHNYCFAIGNRNLLRQDGSLTGSRRTTAVPLTFAVVIISQFIASPTADLSLAAE